MTCWCGSPATIECGLCERHHYTTHVAWRRETLPMCKESSQAYQEMVRQNRQYAARVAELEAQIAALQEELNAERLAAHRESTTVDL